MNGLRDSDRWEGSPDHAPAVFDLECIQKRLGGRSVLDGLTLRVHAGEALAVVGPSGSGKSTLMAVLGMITRWDAGSFTLNGASVASARRSRARARSLGFAAWVPQTPIVLPGRSVLDNVLTSRRAIARPSGWCLPDIPSMLKAVGLDHLRDRDASVLSGGELQRLGVVRALSSGARAILADEPTASLDHANTMRVTEALILNRGAATVVVATHDERVAAACSRVVRLADGVIAEVE